MNTTDLKLTGRVVWSLFWKMPNKMMPVEPRILKDHKVVAVRATKRGPRAYWLTNCYHCGGAFLTSRWDTMYCSDRCRKGANR